MYSLIFLVLVGTIRLRVWLLVDLLAIVNVFCYCSLIGDLLLWYSYVHIADLFCCFDSLLAGFVYGACCVDWFNVIA